jgi:hypothetical protein
MAQKASRPNKATPSARRLHEWTLALIVFINLLIVTHVGKLQPQS